MSLLTRNKLPIDLELLKVNEKDLVKLGRISETSIFDNNGNFHPNGLFSTTIFGAVGSEYRNRVFGYVDLQMELIHPLIYKALTDTKALYKQIAEGKVTAIFDKKIKDFVKSTDENSNTGYQFFIEHLPLLKLEKNNSDKRNFNIDIINNSIKEEKYLMKYLLVMPAGLRDYFVDQSGKPNEDEINTFYRKIVSQCSIIDPISGKKAPEVYNNLRSGIQNSLQDLSEYIISLLEGKNKLILGKWLTRKIFNSTRNVASNFIENVSTIDSPNRINYNEAIVGLHQYLRALVPKSIYEIKNKYIVNIFKENTNSAFITNSKTLLKEEVLNSHIQKEYDLWTTSEGLLQVIASLNNQHIRDLPIILNKGKHYLGLIYKDEKYIKFFHGLDELPDGFDKSKVSPVTLSEFMYLSIYETIGKYPGLITRYPITGYGSVYPVFLKMVTTMSSFTLEELDGEWKPSGKTMYSFPNPDSGYHNTISVHPAHLASLGGDFDGDTLSVTALLSDESIEEITKALSKKEYYFNDKGDFNFNPDTEILNVVLAYMTK